MANEQKKYKSKKIIMERKLVTIKVPAGSLVIPPHKIKSTFKKIFNSALKCNELHPDDDTYDSIHFNKAVQIIMRSFSTIKPS